MPLNTDNNITGKVIAFLMTLLFGIVLFKIMDSFPELQMLYLARPAAWITGLFLGLPCLGNSTSGYILPHPALEIHVVSACSGASFWMLMLCFFYI